MMRLKNKVRHHLGALLFRGRVRIADGDVLEPLTAEQLEAIRHYFHRPKFFVFGHARSGTTLLARLIRLHPEVHCNWQAQFFSPRGPLPYLAAPGLLNWLAHPSNRWTRDQPPVTPLVRVYCDFILEFGAEQVGKEVVGDKSPNANGAQAVRWLHKVYPDARLVYIVRDGRDAVLSRRMKIFVENPRVLGREGLAIREALRRDSRPFLEKRRSVFTNSWLVTAARSWAENVHESAALAREVYGDRFFALRFEDLLESPTTWMAQIWSYLGVSSSERELAERVHTEMELNPAAEWQASIGSDLVRGLPRGEKAGWKEIFTDEDREHFERAAGAELAAWDYPITT